MSELGIILGNKNYSSWSMRPWLALRHADASFGEEVLALYEPASMERLRGLSPTVRVPVLRHGDVRVWESLAICEYVAELFPAAGLWPDERGARAVARAVSAEMHAGFQALRREHPLNVRARRQGVTRSPEVAGDVARIQALWGECRRTYGAGGAFLFGRFTIADAMFAPVVSRFITYGVAVDETSRAYMDAVWAHPAMRAWVQAAEAEPWSIARFDAAAGTPG